MGNKYKLLATDVITPDHRRILYRIEALKSFKDVKIGDLGGYIESEDNLSHMGDAWVYGDAKVYEDATVSGDARAYGNAKIFGDVRVLERATVSGDAKLSGNAKIFGHARVFGDAKVYGNALVFGDAKAYGNAEISGNAKVFRDAEVYFTVCSFSSIYNITILKEFIHVDCKRFTINEIRTGFSEAELIKMDGRDAVDFYERYFSILELMWENQFGEGGRDE